MGIFNSLFAGQIEKEVSKRINTGLRSALTNLYNENIFRWVFEGQVIIDEESFDYAEDGFAAIGAVYECVSLIINKVIACPRIVYRVKDQKEYKKYLNLSKSPETLPQALIVKLKALEEVNHPALDKLLNQPNPKQNGDEFLSLLTALYLLRGNGFIYGNAGTKTQIEARKWSECWALPDTLKIVSGGITDPIQKYYFKWDVDHPFPAAQIKHFKTVNPVYRSGGQHLYGMSPLRPYLYSLNILKNGDKQSASQIKNGGKMGFISPKNKEDMLSTDQKDDMHESLTQAHGSDEPLSRIIPASIPLDWTEIGLSSQEMELLKTTNAKAEDIYRAYKIPLQFRNQDTATYNNLPMANRQLIYNAVAPVCRAIGLGLTEFYAGPYRRQDGENYIIELDYTYLPEMMDDMKTVAEALDKIWYFTGNEKREILRWGRFDQDGMDEIFVNRNQVRLKDVMEGKIAHTANDIGEQMNP